ncbi:hypothetical protein EMIHUDRAFT_460918 [Emiliania huxleyi CCMP1516]|uniref:Uncharacterized protein n=2 Tax=Emiliania huxleyi TaxID=2903 RepID=A0A0D3L0G7_EMIH1|nr:hypothetical protein EMIHUDRAFT_460918 [Emiliania huxleyi CCMP1516]EOD41502.1 hypothetical protein EMIHUDRAFT_460918 [Emiliania huxleyi CCMP1516]|eukprot:XP_005793931.1 hypothetical protein EMIHUDRAFT_460918 [Emiliania huxleyi CCMP1516]
MVVTLVATGLLLPTPALRQLRSGVPLSSLLDDLAEEASNSWLMRFLNRPKEDAALQYEQQGYNTLEGMSTRLEVERSPISEQPVMFTTSLDGTDPSFDFERWEVHRSQARYGRLVLGILFGKTTQRIGPTVLAVCLFSSLVFAYNNVFLAATQFIAVNPLYPELQLPLTPFELTAPVLGLLLVFRTDTAYERFSLGSQLAWEIAALCERAAAEDLIQACTLVHGWIMTSYLRGGLDRRRSAPIDEMQEALLRAALGVEEGEEEEEGGGEARTDAAEPAPAPSPYLWISAMAVAADLAKCEKLVSTPIPLGYTRSSVRFLWIWITLLPFALSRTFADFQAGTWWEDKPRHVDIAVQIEEPFAILPLHVQHQWLLRDAEQTRWLMRYGSRQRVRRAGAAARRGEDRGREEDSSEQDRSEPERPPPEAAVKGEVES